MHMVYIGSWLQHAYWRAQKVLTVSTSNKHDTKGRELDVNAKLQR